MKATRMVCLLAVLTVGCNKAASDADRSAEKWEIVPGNPGASVWARAPMITADLRPFGIEAVIDLPEGCTVDRLSRGNFEVCYQHRPTDWLFTVTRAGWGADEIKRKYKPEARRVLVDTPDTLLLDMGGKFPFVFFHEARVGDRHYSFLNSGNCDSEEGATRMVEIANTMRPPPKD